MKYLGFLLLDTLAVLCSVSASPLRMKRARETPAGVVRMPMSRRSSGKIQRRQTADTGIVEGLVSTQFAGEPYYFVTTEIGTPAQQLDLMVDTGSSDTWVYGAGSSACTAGKQCYDSTASTSVGTADVPEFDGDYGIAGETTVTSGQFVTDTMVVAGVTVDTLDIAVVTSGGGFPAGGIMGLGFTGNEASASNATDNDATYPTILDTMYSQGSIGSRSYSLYLDDITAGSGALIFGGYDTEKYSGSIVSFGVQTFSDFPAYKALAVPFASLTICDSSVSSTPISLFSDTPQAVLLDSGTPTTALPAIAWSALTDHLAGLGYAVGGASNNPTVDCSLAQAGGSLSLGFQDPNSGATVAIDVPFDQLVIDYGAGDGVCTFAVNSQGANDPLIFGDTFMRAMYIVFDLDNSVISLAQSNFNSASSNIVAI